jgi:hypothetical protein
MTSGSLLNGHVGLRDGMAFEMAFLIIEGLPVLY